MTDSIPSQLDQLYDILRLPIVEANLFSNTISSEDEGAIRTTVPVDRTFLCLSFASSPERAIVFYLGASEDAISARIIGEGFGDCANLKNLIRSDDPEINEIGMISISQFLNPVFNPGAARLTGITLLMSTVSKSDDRVIGIVFDFPFGVRFGLHVFDDHRLSMCFNSMCDAILTQARHSAHLKVWEKNFGTDERPHFSVVDWFGWLAGKKGDVLLI